MTVRDEILAIEADAQSDKPGRRARLKALRIQAMLANLPVTFTAGRFSVTISQAAIRNGHLALWIAATRDGVALNLSNPFVFVNPPILVPDPAGDVVLSSSADPVSGQTTQQAYREDLLAAVRSIVVDTLRAVA